MRRIYPQTPDLSVEDQQKLDTFRAEYEALCKGHDSADDLSPEVALQLETLEDALDKAHGEPVYAAGDIARCGAFVYLDSNSGLRIERGYLRREDEPESAAGSSAPPTKYEDGQNGDGDDNEPCRPLSDRLAAELSACHTQALQARLAADSGVALVALLHAFALQTYYRHARLSCLDIDLRPVAFGHFDANMADSRAGKELEAAQAAAGAALPRDPEHLWAFLTSQTQDALLALLSVLIAPCANAITAGNGQDMTRSRVGDALSDALGLDMTVYWTATAEGYFARVSKAQIVAAVREGVSEEAARRIEGLKKVEMAEAAEALFKGRGWLPEPLRAERTETARL
ncbi:MAG: hypothetical protein SGJ17_06295 [Hyphomicrobiales bacterium]|nr:hypothetical protein [Hyphomicrobiales bacterium]